MLVGKQHATLEPKNDRLIVLSAAAKQQKYSISILYNQIMVSIFSLLKNTAHYIWAQIYFCVKTSFFPVLKFQKATNKHKYLLWGSFGDLTPYDIINNTMTKSYIIFVIYATDSALPHNINYHTGIMINRIANSISLRLHQAPLPHFWQGKHTRLNPILSLVKNGNGRMMIFIFTHTATQGEKQNFICLIVRY